MKYTKTLLAIILLLAVIIGGCKKNDYNDNNNNNNNPAADSNAMKFIVNGATDQVLDWTDSATIPLAVTYTGGEQVKLNLALTGLPQGATASFDVTGGTPTFASILTLRTNNTPGGVYNLKLLATTIKDSVKTYDIKLTVNGEPLPCTKAGNYENVQTNIDNPSEVKTVNVTAELTGGKNHLLLKNCLYTNFVDGVNWKNYDVEVVLDCNNKTLKVVRYDFTDSYPYYTIGEGTFTDNTLDFTIKITPNGSYFMRTYHCVVKLK